MSERDALDEAFKELAQDIRRTGKAWPSKSVEWKIMTQDLSRSVAGAIIPNVEFASRASQVARHILYAMPPEYIRFFYWHYFRRASRKRRLKELGVSKDKYYDLRDAFLNFAHGRSYGKNLY